MRLDAFELIEALRDLAAAEAAHAATCPYCIDDAVNAKYLAALSRAKSAFAKPATPPPVRA